MDMFWIVTKYLLIIGTLVVVLIGPVIWNMRRLQRSARNPEIEAEYLRAGCKVMTSIANGREVISGTLSGMPFELTLGTGSRSALQSTSVSIPCALGGNFAVTRSGSRNQSGSDVIESTFSDAGARDAVRALFGLGFDPITLNGGHLTAIRSDKAEMLPFDALRLVVEHLAVIGATTDIKAEPTWLAPSAGTNRICIVSTALLPAGLLLLALGGAHGAAVLQGAWPGIAAGYLVLSALAAFLLRGRPLARGETGFVVFMGLPGLFFGGMGVAMMAGS